MKLLSYGKINIFLNILGKRSDGYHNIETLIQRIDLFDEIEINVDKEFDGIFIDIYCNKEGIPTDSTNLCYIASKWFMEKYDLKGRVNIKIYKNIPSCAGLGGGTSNGAEVIKALNKIYGLNIPLNELSNDTIVLGGDFPYFMLGGTSLCEGIGDRVLKVNSFKDHIVLIVKPNFGFLTKDVYNNFDVLNDIHNVDKNLIIESINNNDFYTTCESISNTLEYSSIKNMDIIRDLKNEILKNGAIGSAMSGSGSSVYGIFDNLYVAQRCYDIFKSRFNDVFLTRTIDK